MARVIAIASGKGGVGKTTVAMNIGTALAHKFNKKVSLIDCNITTSHLGMYMGIYYSPVTLNKVLRGEVPMDMFADDDEIVILDGAPGLGREAISALKAADEVIFVTTPYVPSVMDIIRTMEIVNEVGVKPIGIILNMVSKEKYEMTSQEVEQLTRLPVIGSLPYHKDVKKSLVEKLPIVLFNQNSKVSKKFHKLAADLISQPYEEDASFIKKIFNKIRNFRKDDDSNLLAPELIPTNNINTLFSVQKNPTNMELSNEKMIYKNNPEISVTPIPSLGSRDLEKPEMPHPEMPADIERPKPTQMNEE